MGKPIESGEVVWRENLPLDDREVDLDLVKPTGMYWPMHKREAGEPVLEAGDGRRSAVRRSVIDDPEYTACVVIGWASHDLFDETMKRRDASGRFAAAEDARVMDVQRGQIGPSATAVVFVFDAHRLVRPWSRGRVFAAAGLNTGLFVGGDHEFIWFQEPPVPGTGVQIEDAAGLDGEMWIAWEDPTAVIPRSNRILMKPTPYRAVRNLGDQAGLTHLPSDVRRIPVGEGKIMSGGQFTSEGLDLHHQFWGEKSGGDPDETAPPVPSCGLRRTVCATS